MGVKVLINHEVPVKNLEEATFNDYGYALAHNLENESYREYFCQLVKTKPVYLDNSAFELGRSVPAEYLEECYAVLDHNCKVFLPDVLGNAQETVALSQEFTQVIKGPCWGVIQGKDIEEQSWCLKQMLKITDSIALPYISVDRPKFLEVNDAVLSRNGVQIHLLGVRDMRELVSIKQHPNIVSVDTSLPVVLGCFGETLTLDSPKNATPVWDIDVDKLPEQVYKNAEFFRSMVNG